MKSHIYLTLPVATTALNLLFAYFIIKNKAVSVDAQSANNGGLEGIQGRSQCTRIDAGQGVLFTENSTKDYSQFMDETETDELLEEDEEDEDPMPAKIPGLDFKAYRRADISSFYQEPPGSRTEKKPSFTGQAGKFVNMSPERLDLHWDAGQGPPGNHMSKTGPFESTGTATFPGHVFYFVKPKTDEVACSFAMVQGTSVYYCNPFVDNDNDPSSGVYSGERLSLKTTLSEEMRKLYDAAIYNREFAGLYRNFTGGSEWLANYPSKPPQHHIWRADYFGQEHQVESQETQFVKLPPQDELQVLSRQDMRRHKSAPISLSKYREPGTMNITIKAVSCAPRIFQIDNFLSEVEVDHLLDLALKKNLQRSTTSMDGDDASVSTVRTSRTTWIQRHNSPIVDAIIRRAADALKIDEAMMRHRTSDEFPDLAEKTPINEDFQVVHYSQSQQYTAHHDFGYPDTRPNAPSRSINLCIYLNEGMTGGETAFPRWRNADTYDAVKAVPKKGKAMIFYMKNPDGNLDDLSQHAAMPVLEGEKWFLNLWSWDPIRD